MARVDSGFRIIRAEISTPKRNNAVHSRGKRNLQRMKNHFFLSLRIYILEREKDRQGERKRESSRNFQRMKNHFFLSLLYVYIYILEREKDRERVFYITVGVLLALNRETNTEGGVKRN